MMLTYNHFWTVMGQNEEIETKFNQAISKSKQLFIDYKAYANDRIEKYDRFLTSVIHNKDKDVATYHQIGFLVLMTKCKAKLCKDIATSTFVAKYR